tara:strand:- start:348 stop:539 length:192 start_codon:yes stop_codon:yes gene_type:complete
MAPHKVNDKILLVPRNDGFLVSVDGKVYLVPQTAMQIMHLGIKCLQAGLEMQRMDRKCYDNEH